MNFVIRHLALIAAASQDDLSILGIVFQEPLICHLRFRGFLTSCRQAGFVAADLILGRLLVCTQGLQLLLQG